MSSATSPPSTARSGVGFHVFTPTEVDDYRDFQKMIDCPQSDQDIGYRASLLIELFMALWLVSWIADLVLSRYWKPYRRANLPTRRNIITYFHEIFITTALMIWCFILLDPILFNNVYNKNTIHQMLFVGLCVIVIYIFELIYRHEMRWQLLLHHLVTILLVMLCIYKFEHDSFIGSDRLPVLKRYNLKGAILMALTALTEQPIFIGLLCYRIGYKSPKLFYFSCIQNAVCKLILHAGLIVVYFKEEVYLDDFWKWFVWVGIEGVLLPVQLYACWIQFSIGRRLERKLENEGDDVEAPKADETSPKTTEATKSPQDRTKKSPRRGPMTGKSSSKSHRSHHETVMVQVSDGFEVEVDDESASSGEHSDDDYTAPNHAERDGDFTLAAPRSPPSSSSSSEDSSEEEDAVVPSRRERRGSILYAQTRTASPPVSKKAPANDVDKKRSRSSKGESKTKSPSAKPRKKKNKQLSSTESPESPDSSTRMIQNKASSSSSS